MITGFKKKKRLRMNLLHHIKKERIHQGKKQPFEREIYTKISSLVRKYCLGTQFIKKLDDNGDYSSGKNLEVSQIKAKRPFEFPLFSLSTQNEHNLTMSIISKVNNPYLTFAHSPEEILLCVPLHQMNPSLRPEKLIRYDYKTLVQYEFAKKQVKNLMEQSVDTNKKNETDSKKEKDENGRSQISTVQEQIQSLQNFIAKVENTGKENK
jgi:hypothetical protein